MKDSESVHTLLYLFLPEKSEEVFPQLDSGFVRESLKQINKVAEKIETQVDVVLAMLMLHHLEDLDSVFQRVSKMMCSGGRFIVLDMCLHKQVELRRNMGHIHLGFSRDSLEEIATKHQLQLCSWHGIKKPEETVGPELFLAVFQLP